MPYRKAEHIAQLLRERILSGKMPPGTKLPSYDELSAQFGVSRPTVSRLLNAMRREGLVTAKGGRSVYVAERLPHHYRYYWVTSEQPGSLEWTRFLATFVELIERGKSGLPGQVEVLLGVDGRANNPAYRCLSDAVKQESAAGLLLVNSATIYQLPALQTEGIPRVAIGAALPHAGLVSLAFDQLFERACRRLAEVGRRIAVMCPHGPNLRTIEASLVRNGISSSQVRLLHIGVLGCERITQLLFERSDRPDTLFLTDDNLVEPTLAGLQQARVEPGSVHILSHCNWPRPLGLSDGIEHLGFDVREIFAASRTCIEALRGGEPAPAFSVPPRFLSELTQPLWES
jgi:DNA-binding transcriptional regulator YhcF (GntR family)